MNAKTPNEPKVSGGIRVRWGVGLVMALTFLCMAAYEAGKEAFAPKLTKWESHWLTIGLSTLIASLCTCLALRRQQRGDKLQFLLRLNERQQAQAAVGRLHEENQRLLASVPLILIGFDNDGRVTKWNQAAEAILGVGAGAAVGTTVEDLSIPWDAKRVAKRLRECLAERRCTEVKDLVLKRPNEEPAFLNVSITPVSGDDGSPLQALLLGTDMTERRILETQLAQAQKVESFGQLAAGIAHEINTPIQYVGDNVTFLKGAFADFQRVLDKQDQIMNRSGHEAPDDSARAEMAETAASADLAYLREEVPRAFEQTLEGVSRVAKIVRAMKEFSHPGNGSMVSSDLNKLIENTIAVAQNEWKYVAEMAVQLDPMLPQVACIAGEFNQVILNLIVNAAHAIADRIKAEPSRKGLITISTRAIAGGVEVRVQDTGTGIPEGARSKIFLPFFTTKAVGKGTGQGLAIAQAVIVKKHGGTIDFETEIGTGTTFIIKLPCSQSYNGLTRGVALLNDAALAR
jgi:PAS domain S-box-containing protein